MSLCTPLMCAESSACREKREWGCREGRAELEREGQRRKRKTTVGKTELKLENFMCVCACACVEREGGREREMTELANKTTQEIAEHFIL